MSISRGKAIAILAALILIPLVVMFIIRSSSLSQGTDMNFSEFMEEVEGGTVLDVTITDSAVAGRLLSGERFTTYIPMEYPELLNRLSARGVVIRGEPGRRNGWMSGLMGMMPLLLIIGVWIFFMRRMQGGGSQAKSFGKSKARMLLPNQKRITFKDAGGSRRRRKSSRRSSSS